MKIEVNKERIADAVYKAERLTGKNLSLPVLSCVLLEAKGKSLFISSTNLDVGLELEIPAKVEEEGVLAVPGAILSQYLSSLNRNENILNIYNQDKNLYIKSNSSETVILTIPHEDFPLITKISVVDSFKMESGDLIEGFKSVWYSASISNIKPELSSVYIYPEGDEVYFVATDSFRLAEKRIKIGKTEGFESTLIPHRNATEIIKTIEDIDSALELIFTEDQLIIKSKGVYMVSRIVDGSFPDYKQIIPKEEKTIVTLLKEDFIQATKVSNIFSDNFNQAEITISPSDSVFEISTKNKDRGESINKLKVNAEGETVKMSFNSKYINDCLSSIKSESLRFTFSGTGKPLIITGSKDGTFRYLVMPMNK